MFYRSVQCVRQSKSLRFVLEANEVNYLLLLKTGSQDVLHVLDGMEHGHNVWYQLCFGVRQGSVLTKFFFNIYLDNLAKINNCAKILFIIIAAYPCELRCT